MSKILIDARRALEAVDIPDPPAHRTYDEVNVYEVTGPAGERLLLAFGTVPMAQWLDVVNGYHNDPETEVDEPWPWVPTNADKVVDCLNRVHYHRVAYDAETADPQDGYDFTILWNTQGIIPVTIWFVHPRKPEAVDV